MKVKIVKNALGFGFTEVGKTVEVDEKKAKAMIKKGVAMEVKIATKPTKK